MFSLALPLPHTGHLEPSAPQHTVRRPKAGAVQACSFHPSVRKGVPCLPADSTSAKARAWIPDPILNSRPFFRSQPAQPYSSPLPSLNPWPDLNILGALRPTGAGLGGTTGLNPLGLGAGREGLAFPKGLSQPRSPGEGSPLPDLRPSPRSRPSRVQAAEAAAPPARESLRGRSSGLRLRAGEGPSGNCCHLLPPPLPLPQAWGRG